VGPRLDSPWLSQLPGATESLVLGGWRL
jgi:hypothetical protein